MSVTDPASACQSVRPGLSRVAEGEATPREALAAAHHTECCTACRILLARDRRLVEMLEGALPEIEVDEDFVDRVMRRLPRGRPPRRRRWILKVAGLGILAGMALSTVSGRWLPVGGSLHEPWLPAIAPEAAEGTLRGFDLLRGVMQWMLIVLDTATRLPQGLPTVSMPLTAAVLLLGGAGLVAALAGSTLFALGAGTLIRIDRQSG